MLSRPRTILLAVLGCTLIAAAVFSWHRTRSTPAPIESALVALPENATLAVTADLGRFDGVAIRTLMADDALRALGGIRKTCGLEPLEHVREVALAVRAAGSQLELGLAAAGDFDGEPFARCAESLVRTRGGEPVRTTVGSFTTVRDRRRGWDGEVAVRDGGPLLVGGGTYLREMIDASEGRIPALATDPAHAKLRAALGEPHAVVATLLPPAGWVQRVAGEAAARRSPLAAIEAVTIGLAVGDDVIVDGRIRCRTAETCRAVGDLLQELPGLLAAPGEPDRQRLVTRLAGVTLEIGGKLTASELRDLFEGAGIGVAPLTRAAIRPAKGEAALGAARRTDGGVARPSSR